MDCGLVARRVGCQAASGWPFVAQRLLPFPKPCHGQRGPVTWNRDCLAALGAFGTSAPSNGKGSTGGSSSGKQRRRSGRRTGSKGLTGLDETPHLAASDGELDVAHDDREDAGSAVPSLPSAAAPALDPAAPSPPHVSVMLHEVLAAFQPVQLRTYLDCTLGAGGHAAALAAAHPVGRGGAVRGRALSKYGWVQPRHAKPFLAVPWSIGQGVHCPSRAFVVSLLSRWLAAVALQGWRKRCDQAACIHHLHLQASPGLYPRPAYPRGRRR